VDLQIKTFQRAVTNLRLKDSLFALTGGLDTRAILAVLSQMDARPIACTISGNRTACLDARLAIALCREYGLQHILVTLGDQFVRDLPTYVLEASRLSGGIASVEQAHEVYFYRQVKDFGSRRLSGNLGNQLGRRGVEGVSTRNAAVWVLHEDLNASTSTESGKHWLAAVSGCSPYTLLQLLLEREVPFSSVGNFGIGHHFMIQQTPYANRRLIEAVMRSPLENGVNNVFTPRRARFRDMSHRFFGQPTAQSFQCKVIQAVGGAAASYPINWGWRIAGGVSLRGVSWGIVALADMVSAARYPRYALIRRGLSAVGLLGLSDITQYRLWLDTTLREFANDTLRSRSVKESGLFRGTALVRLLDEHYDGVMLHHSTLLATLDLALAHQVFTASPATYRPVNPCNA